MDANKPLGSEKDHKGEGNGRGAKLWGRTSVVYCREDYFTFYYINDIYLVFKSL